MDIGIKRVINVKKTKAKLSRYLPEGEKIEDDQQLLDLFELYNKVGRDCLDEVNERTRVRFLEILASEIEAEIGSLLPTKPRKVSWRSLGKEKKDFLMELYLRSVEAGRTQEEIAEDFRAYFVRGKKKFEVLR